MNYDSKPKPKTEAMRVGNKMRKKSETV